MWYKYRHKSSIVATIHGSMYSLKRLLTILLKKNLIVILLMDIAALNIAQNSHRAL